MKNFCETCYFNGLLYFFWVLCLHITYITIYANLQSILYGAVLESHLNWLLNNTS